MIRLVCNQWLAAHHALSLRHFRRIKLAANRYVRGNAYPLILLHLVDALVKVVRVSTVFVAEVFTKQVPKITGQSELRIFEHQRYRGYPATFQRHCR